MRQHSIELLPITVAGVEAVNANSDISFGRHTHDQFGIGLMDSGGQKSLSGRGYVESNAGDVITVNPGEVHDGAPLDGSRAWRMLYFDTELINRCFIDISEGKFASGEFALPVSTNAGMAKIFNQLYQAIISGNGDIKKLAADEALLILTKALAQMPRSQMKMPIKGVLYAKEKMDDAPGSAISLTELASIAGLGQFTFLRAFARYCGMTPHAYLLQRRQSLVRKLIRGGMNLVDAAIAGGFADQSHMTRLFVRSYGYTPGLYAQQNPKI
ncbi:AraC family transcriptional regulator [Leclercia adecarboxylata]|uniref:AraC family transcriptional regulator n=1 Tax=Leclercia adecarboxylata TaxID=83655 RepID=A0A9X3YAA8_9ENTR|nr:AraC family transcriptional regulator [Leclercia adecarboxylata]MBD1403987.1 AraC family transcriptional regulator [Leclercia adecarboxylata]MDC6622936.1 AraC family transcriptional regulator [Leclercia adecarboxylata]MDC6634133.1 AraC family transcriptional regulator [Leclercia adecarboxylata]MDC6639138.1 AraC family transcriptional regulator [Leclercia adecarboxylata]MDC6647950.1 AraC family transcriptional regulator [Leclercia adecarboxylata]